jgi:Nitrile hydratase beta subunit, C-terminal
VTFGIGDAVHVRDDWPAGHVRTPAYVRGKSGWIERVHGDFRNPEQLAYGRDGLPPKTLYMVGFKQTDLWPDRYRASRDDCLYVDIYEHWLERI